MISDALLRRAAKLSCEVYAAQLERGFDPAEEREFSIGFEKKIKKLQRRADHPVFYHTMQRAASFLLAVLLSGAVLLAASSEARATVRGWIKEIYDVFFVYRFEDDQNSEISPAEYRLSWLPEGYEESTSVNQEGSVTVLYKDANGKRLRFSYIPASTATEWFVDTSNMIHSVVEINNCSANLFISPGNDIANVILWVEEETNTAFHISAFLSEDDLIRVAENIRKK